MEVLEEIRQIKEILNSTKDRIVYVTFEDKYGSYCISTVKVFRKAKNAIAYLDDMYGYYGIFVSIDDLEKMKIGECFEDDKFKIIKVEIS